MTQSTMYATSTLVRDTTASSSVLNICQNSMKVYDDMNHDINGFKMYVPLTGRLMFTVTLSLGDRGYTREVWTWPCDMEVGGSVNEDMCVHHTAA